jgi:ABC-type polysaccharide/polyol phosphate export permease
MKFIKRDLKDRYFGSTAGVFWAVVQPLILLVVYTFVFSILLKIEFAPRVGVANFVLYLFCGMVPWNTIYNSIHSATTCIIANSNLIKRANFPASFLPTHIVISNHIGQFIWLTILFVAILLVGYPITVLALLIPVVMFFQILFTLGICWVLSCITVFFRDAKPFVETATIVWMFMTPIFYPESAFPERYKLLLILNPMSHIVGIYRELLLNCRLPHPNSALMLFLSSVILLVLGYLLFSRNQPKFADLV